MRLEASRQRGRGLALLLSIACSGVAQPCLTARAEDAVSIWGSYYKERSTRVVSPTFTLHKELPLDTSVDVSYVVDQITSASSAVTHTDAAFHEYRNEVDLGAHMTLLDDLTPGLSLRYSYEGDYASWAIGADIGLSMFQGMSTVRGRVQYQHDGIRNRGQPGFSDTLTTTMAGLEFVQILRKDLIAGVALETQALSGYTENPYRVEQHPRNRNRYAASSFLAFRFEPTRSTLRLDYRLYADTWDLVGHTFTITFTERILPWLEIVPRFRFYTQGDVFFADLADCSSFFPDSGGTAKCITSDPKLVHFASRYYALRAVVTLSVLDKTPLSPFAKSRIEPSYGYLDQDNAYGPAHIIEVGWYWPF